MKSLCLNALVAFLAILWAINVEAATKDIGDPIDEIKIKVTPSCFVVGAPVEFVVVNTDLDYALAEGATFELRVDNDDDKVAVSNLKESDGRGELVVKFSFPSVTQYVVGTDDVEIWFYIIYSDGSKLTDEAFVRVHDYSKLD